MIISKDIKNKTSQEIFNFRSSLPEVLCGKSVLRNFVKFTAKHLCQSLLFSCEFYEISKNNFFYRMPPVASSVISLFLSIPGK